MDKGCPTADTAAKFSIRPLPGTVAQAGQTPLPKDLESAATEQVAAWYQKRDKLGLIRHWPSGGTYLSLSQLAMLPAVAATLRRYQRWLV
jgi:hypothetical protein